MTERTPTSKSRWWPRSWERPWIAPLVVICVVFLAFSLPPYLAMTPRIELRESIWMLHFWLVAAHISFGSIALMACCVQVWPWFRGRFPAVHRWIGRIYVFAGVLPAGLLGVLVSVLHSQGVAAQLGNLLLSLLWLYTSWAGYRAARERRFAEHRKWMVRAFMLCFSIVVNRLWVLVTLGLAMPQLESTYKGDEIAMVQSATSAAVWLSWVVNLLIAEWWLQYRGAARRRRPATPRTPEPTAGSATGTVTEPIPQQPAAVPAGAQDARA
ncbi:DUF2306 domain-containing protein [Nonomuraea sp. K274]|uniref:DUF2306 domain-containing protein n=1 Tax=Nonomuraea cypriaca TaxID=1187855 RepID=A0A931A7U6_9ACTN|nr:DUF2306 domain-containing protein [Nonomuraea cypriaca]MBF8185024.1 DUF2306 domain-containing protein [Nonomuraea cypriaca]